MGLLEDIKKEWTWEGFKKSIRKDWLTLLSVAISGFLTPIVLKSLGKEDSGLLFILVNLTLFVLVSIATGVVLRIKRKITK